MARMNNAIRSELLKNNLDRWETAGHRNHCRTKAMRSFIGKLRNPKARLTPKARAYLRALTEMDPPAASPVVVAIDTELDDMSPEQIDALFESAG